MTPSTRVPSTRKPKTRHPSTQDPPSRRQLGLAMLWLMSLLVLPCGGLSGQASRSSLAAVPEVTLQAAEPAVQERVRSVREELLRMLARPDVPDQTLAQAFGEAGELFLIYDLTDAARACLRNATTLAPDTMRWHYLLATLDELEARMSEAAEGYRRAAQLDPDDPTVRARLAEVELRQGELDRAEEEWTLLLSHAPFRAVAWYGLGRIAAQRGDHERAVESFLEALAEQPNADVVQYQLALSYRQLGNQDKAREHLASRGETRVRFPDPIAEEVRQVGTGVGTLMIAGRSASRTGDLGLALERFRAAVEIAPDNASAHRALGSVLMDSGQIEEALEHFDESARLDPINAGLQMFVAGQLQTHRPPTPERDERLVELFDLALVQTPDLLEAWLGKTQALKRLGRAGEAEQAVARALTLAPEAPGLVLLRAQLLQQLGRLDEARAELTRVDSAATAPEVRAQASFRLGNLDVESGDLESAAALYRTAIELSPELAEAHFNLATVLGRLQRYDEAASFYAQTLALQPENHGARVGEAGALLLNHQDGLARQRLEQAIQLYPEEPGYASLLARVLVASPDDSVRDGARGLDLAKRLFEYEASAEHAETVAMALAENGRFEEAAALQTAVVERLEQDGDPNRDAAAQRLALYRRGEPARSPWE